MGFCAVLNARLYSILENALSVWTNLGRHSLFVWLYILSIKTGTRRIICLDELSSVVRHSSRTTEGYSSRRIMCPVPVFLLETYNQKNNECLRKFVQTDNASSSINTAIENSTKPKTKHKTKTNHKTQDTAPILSLKSDQKGAAYTVVFTVLRETRWNPN